MGLKDMLSEEEEEALLTMGLGWDGNYKFGHIRRGTYEGKLYEINFRNELRKKGVEKEDIREEVGGIYLKHFGINDEILYAEILMWEEDVVNVSKFIDYIRNKYDVTSEIFVLKLLESVCQKSKRLEWVYVDEQWGITRY